MIREIAKAINFMVGRNLVHGDLNPQNVCPRISKDKTEIECVKLVGYAKSYSLAGVIPFEYEEPEYQPPEILNYIKKCRKI